MLRLPILIEIRKEGIKAKELNGKLIHEGELRVEPSKVLSFRGKYNVLSESPLSNTGPKAFYQKDNLLIDDVQLTATALKWLFRPLSESQLLKPDVILNVPYEMTKVEIVALREAAELASVRELIIFNEANLPVEQTMKPNHKIPGKIVYGEDRFSSDEKVFALLLIPLFILGWLFFWFKR